MVLIDNSLPLSPYFVLLTAALALGFRALYVAVRLSVSDQDLYIPITVCAFPLLWLLATHICGSLTQRFDVALIGGTIPLALAGIATIVPPVSRFVKPKGTRTASPKNRAQKLATLGAIAFSIWLILPAVVFWDIFDRYIFPSGHFAIAQQIANGVYPPRDLAFVEDKLFYHYGVDTLAAMLMTVFRVRVDVAFDLITVAGWGAFLTLVAVMAPARFGMHGRTVFVLIVALGGSFPWWLEYPGSTTNVLLSHYDVLNSMNPFDRLGGIVSPPTNAMLFQGSWVIGYLAFGLACVGLTKPEAVSDAGEAWLVGLSIAALGVANTAMFLAVGGASLGVALVGIASPLFLGHPAHRIRALVVLPGIVAGIIVGALANGILLHSWYRLGDPAYGQIAVSADPRMGDWQATILWNLACFGLLIPVAIAAFRRVRDYPAFLLSMSVLVIGSILASNFLIYPRSWDTTKFATIAILSASFLAASFVSVQLSRGRWWIAGVISLGLVSPGIAFHTAFWLFPYEIRLPPPLGQARDEMGADSNDKSSIAWLRARIAPGESVLCPPRLSLACVVLGGLPQTFVKSFIFPKVKTPQHYRLGYPIEKIERRWRMAIVPPKRMSAYTEIGVRWILVGSNDLPWSTLAEKERLSGNAIIRAEFGSSKVYEVFARYD